MFVWSKRLVAVLLAGYFIAWIALWASGGNVGAGETASPMIRWMTLNYVGLAIWIFVWMIDQARVRGKNIWLWLLPFIFIPLPTLMIFILFLQRRLKA